LGNGSPKKEQEVAEKKEAVKNVEIRREGLQIILPEKLSYEDAIEWITRKAKEELRKIQIHETVDALPLEGAYAFGKALNNICGFFDVKPPQGWDDPPVWISLEVGYKQTVQVLWGMLQVPGVTGHIQTSVSVENGNIRFLIIGEVRKKDQDLINRLVAETKRVVAEESIYRNKAIQLGFPDLNARDFNPILFQQRFLDTSKINPEQLIFPESVRKMVSDTLFAPLLYTDAVRAAKIPLKRGILLEGPYGCGKTLTQYVTAKYATENGWTYIAVEDTSKLADAMHFAKNYQPAVVVAEDIDRADKGGNRSNQMNVILNTIDGASFKDTEIIVLLTTNHVENITPAMLRPGRLDAVIPVRPPDAAAVEKLIHLYAGELIDFNAPLETVGQALAGQIPAVIREVVERSKLSAISRQLGVGSLHLTESDLMIATTGMMEHLNLMKVKEPDTRSYREKAADRLGSHIKDGLRDMVHSFHDVEQEEKLGAFASVAGSD
jgi:transitional endoplasmic reticulum ATPase